MIRNKLQRLMYGRYGNDALNNFLILCYLACYVLFLFTHHAMFHVLTLVLIGFTLFRMLSKNIVRRQAENAAFYKVAGPFLRWVRLKHMMHSDKQHCYFRCPNCGLQLRVPRGKGKITITCRGCQASFQEKT